VDEAQDLRPPTAQELRCGTPELQPLSISLRAGPITCRYEAGDLRDILVAGVQLVQRIYVGVRDHQWSTIPGAITRTEIEVHSRSFRIAYSARHRQDEVDIERRMVLSGGDDGTISCAMDGEVLRDFRSNRLGFCVLHPTPHCAGAGLTIVHVDGSRESGHFPRTIAPAAPFTDIAAIEQAISPSCGASIAFAGEVFEMEDQRNYGDSSFKTYSTPQARPKPALRQRGERIRQEVTIRLQGTISDAAEAESIIRVAISAQAGPLLPRVGLAVPAGPALDERQRALIRTLQPAHLRVTLRLGPLGALGPLDTLDQEALATAAGEAAALGCDLEVVVLVAQDAIGSLPALAALARRLQAPVRAWLVMPADGSTTTATLAAAARRELAGAVRGARIGGGAHGHVISLTTQPPAAGLDEIAFPLHAQVHATDTSTLFDNLASHAEIITDLRARCPGALLAPGPITLAPLGGDCDEPRQRALVAAAWTCASISAMAAAGAWSGCWHELSGRLGVLPAGAAHAGPSRCAVHPVWQLLADLAEFAGATTFPATISAPGRIAVLGLRDGERTRILVANLTPEVQPLSLSGLDHDLVVTVLDETCAWRAMCDPLAWRAAAGKRQSSSDGMHALSLRPYALARLDRIPVPG
jgi:D-apionolactonase